MHINKTSNLIDASYFSVKLLFQSYQNIKMRISSFLAFKLFNVAAPPSTLPARPVWKLHNTEDVYKAIQALDIHTESSYSGNQLVVWNVHISSHFLALRVLKMEYCAMNFTVARNVLI